MSTLATEIWHACQQLTTCVPEGKWGGENLPGSAGETESRNGEFHGNWGRSEIGCLLWMSWTDIADFAEDAGQVKKHITVLPVGDWPTMR